MKTFHVGGMNPLRRYKSLEAALAQAGDDDTIELHKNITFSGKVAKNIILEGNGHAISVTNGTVGLDCSAPVVIRNVKFISEPRSNALLLHSGGRLENVTTKIKGPARVLFPAVIVKNGTLTLEGCDIMRLSAEAGSKVRANDTVFRDYYGAVWHLEKYANLSLFSGAAELTSCQLDCCYFIGRAVLENCHVGSFNRSCGDVRMEGCVLYPEVNKPAVNIKREPADGPLMQRNENTKFAFEVERGTLSVSDYASHIPEEFVGFHVLNGTLDIKDTANDDTGGYHLIRHGSVSFTNVEDAAFYDIQNATVSKVNSTVRTSTKTETAMERLEGLIGLGSVKQSIRSIVNTIARNRSAKNKDFGFSYHMVFAGDPGTGKTTVAKIVAQALFEIGAVPENKCTEVAADTLVKGYVGQTAEHVREVLDHALGGVLFIDEAYELSIKPGQNSFNSEVLSVLIRYMEEHRDQLVVIAAGYRDEMREFLASNVGLTRRFQWVDFPDYNAAEMAAIFESIRESYGESYEKPELSGLIPQLFGKLSGIYRAKPDIHGRTTNGGNGGLVRNAFQQILVAKNNRLAERPGSADTVTQDDIMAGFRAEMEKAVQV